MRQTLQKQSKSERARPSRRVENLAVLPLFFRLEDRSVLLSGGTVAAAWKAELLAAAGATVHIYAEHLDEEFQALIAVGSKQGKFVHHTIPWSGEAFEGKALAIADAASEGEAQAFYCASKNAGVPVNVIDNPPFCEFQFGSIVNRSPVVIGISTNGVAPILGQAIRRKIETLIPAALADWAALAGRVRVRVMTALEPGPERRRFWEKFVDLSFSGEAVEDTSSKMISDAKSTNSQNTGSVTLAGAGPGDSEFLTLKAVRALQGADVILFDDLVDDSVLELARREAKRMLVGKRGGRESCRQEDINDMMVKLARQGKSVVRLKSGDPMVFGRAGEELERLAEEGIPASVVPGVTAASAMAAQLGVSLTHRDCAQSVRFVTAHSRKGVLPETVDWSGLADTATTTVFYMGRRMAGQISRRLIDEGRAPETPVCAMANVARPNAASWSGVLSDLAAGVESLQTNDPVLIAVGEVFADKRNKEMVSGVPEDLHVASM